jgi:hypothetical protein
MTAAAALPPASPYRLDDLPTDEWYPASRQGSIVAAWA